MGYRFSEKDLCTVQMMAELFFLVFHNSVTFEDLLGSQKSSMMCSSRSGEKVYAWLVLYIIGHSGQH